jgi:hypothetical protein
VQESAGIERKKKKTQKTFWLVKIETRFGLTCRKLKLLALQCTLRGFFMSQSPLCNVKFRREEVGKSQAKPGSVCPFENVAEQRISLWEFLGFQARLKRPINQNNRELEIR